MDESKYADLFESIFGFRPKKSGQSYELLVAAAIKAVLPSLKVKVNQYVAGTFSGEKYQLDALIESLEKMAVEAKDYSQNAHKVGRPDVSKLAGALNDLPLDGGIVASATDFTRHAKKYSEGTKANPGAKPIDLIHVRQSTEEDENGRIKTIHIRLHLFLSDFKNAKWQPVLTPEGEAQLLAMFPDGKVPAEPMHAFYKRDGSIFRTIEEFTRGIGVQDWELRKTVAEWVPDEPAFIKVSGNLIPMHSFKYEISFNVMEQEIVVQAEGTATLLVKSEDGKVDKLVTDADLKKLTIHDDGSVD